MILKRKRRISQDKIIREEEDKSAFDEEEKVEPME